MTDHDKQVLQQALRDRDRARATTDAAANALVRLVGKPGDRLSISEMLDRVAIIVRALGEQVHTSLRHERRANMLRATVEMLAAQPGLDEGVQHAAAQALLADDELRLPKPGAEPAVAVTASA